MYRRLHRIRAESGRLDIDRRGFYLPPADLEWSLAGVPEQLETDNEEVYWEIEKFIRLALKANPNVLECFYSPLVETCSPLAQELIMSRNWWSARSAVLKKEPLDPVRPHSTSENMSG